MVYGLQATGDTILTDIARAVVPKGKRRNTEHRISRNLKAEGKDDGQPSLPGWNELSYLGTDSS